MEVTLKTEVEAGASGFSVTGGGNEGIFIKKVLKESPASKIFSLREGDQLLSATIFFDNIKYEDALKILQYSEPYRIQFSLKRKIAGKEELEHIHSAAQYKKERLSQEKELSESIPEETLHVSGKAISEEDRETLIVSQRVGRSKRPKKDRLSWPKFQSIKNKKILGHRRSHSTSDAYEPAIQDISPTSTDTESQFQQEVHIKEKKGNQKKLKFPSIGFKIEKIHEDISLENPEILTVEYTTSPAYEIKPEEVHETLTEDLKDMTNGIPSQAKTCPEAEISIKKEKEKESISKFTVPEVPAMKTQISKPSLEKHDLKESPTKQTPQTSSKARKKKQKGTADKLESGISIDMMGHKTQGPIQVKGLEIGTAKAELHTVSDTLETGEKEAEEETKILTIQKTRFGISLPKRKELVMENKKAESDIPHSVPEITGDTSSEDGCNLDVKSHIPHGDSDVSNWKIQTTTFKRAQISKFDIKMHREESRDESVDSVKKEHAEEDIMCTRDKALKMDSGVKTGEKDVEAKESKFRLPKIKLPTFTWATTKDESGQKVSQESERDEKRLSLQEGGKPERSESAEEGKNIKAAKIDADVSLHKVDASIPGADLKADVGAISIAAPDVKVPSLEGSLELQAPEIDLKVPSGEGSLDAAEPESVGLKGKLKMPKFDKPKFGVSPPKAEGLEGEVSLPTAEVELPSATVTAAGEGPALGIKADVPGAKTEGAGWKVEKPSLKMPKADIKAPKVDISLPSVDVTLPKAGVDLPAPEAALSLEGEAKAPEKEAAKTKDGKFKMPKFGMPSFGWSSSREAKGTVAADVDVSLKEPQVTVPSGTAEVDVTLPAADIQAPGVEVTVETAAGGDGEKGRFKMPDVKMPSVKLPKVKAPHVQVSLPKAEVSLPKAQAEVQAGEVALQGPDAEGGLEVSAGKVEAGGMKIHMPKVKVPGVVFSKPTVKAPKIDADVSLPGADLKADVGAISIAAPDVKVPSLEGSLELQAPEIDLKVPSGEGSLDAAEPESVGLKGKLKMPKFDKPKFGVSPPKAEGLEGEVSLPTAEVELPSATVTAAGEGPALGIKADVPGAKTEGAGWKVEKPSLKMPKADIKAPKVDISLPSVDVTLPKAGVDLPAPEAALSLEGEAKAPEKEAAKTKDGKFKMPKFGMPSFGWSSSREAKGTVAADVDVSLKEPQVTVPSGTAEVDVTLPAADIQAPGVEVTVETAAGGDGEKGRFKMPDVKMPSVKLPKVKAPHVQVSLPKAEVSLPKAQAEVQAGEVALQGPDAEGGLEVSAGKVEAGGMKIHMPKVKVPGVVFSKPTVKAPKIDADVSLPGADLKADVGAISIAAPDVKVPSLEGSLELQAPEIDLKVPSGEGSLDAAEPESVGLKGKLKMPKFDKPKFGVSPPKAEGLEGEVSLPTAEVELPSATVTAAGEGPALGIKADVPGAKTEGAGWKVEKPSLKMPKADIKAPKVDISLPSVDVTLPKAGVDLPAPEAALSLEGEAKAPEKEAAKTKDGKFKMPKFGMPSFGWSSSREAKGTVAADVDVSLKEPQVTVPSGTAEVDVTLPAADIQAPGVEVTVETAAGGDGEKGRFKMPDVKMPSVKLPKVKAPHVQVSLPKAEVSLPKAQAEVQAGEVALQGPDAEGGLEVSAGKVEAGGMKIHMPKVKVPGVVFSKPTVKAPKIDADVSLPGADLKADVGAISIAAPDVKVPSLEGSLELQAPEIDLKVPSGEGSLDAAELESVGLKGKLKMPKFDKPKFGVSPPKAEGLEGEVSLPTAEVELPSATVTAAGEGPALGIKADVPGAKTEGAGWKVEKPSLKMPKADIKAPKVDISLPSVDVTLPKAGVDLLAPEAALSLEGEAKAPEKEAAKTKDGKFKMPKFGMPSFGWSSSREAKGTVAADVDVSLKEPQVTVPSGTAEVDVTLPAADIQAPGVEVTVETAAGGDGEKGRFKMPDVKMPSVKLPKVKAPHVQVSLPKAEVSLPKAQAEVQAGEVALQGPDAEGGLEVSAGKVEAGGMKIHMPKVKVPGVVFSKPTVKAPKIDADVSLPGADLKADVGAISIAAPDVKVPSLEGSLELQAPEIDLRVPSGEGSLDAAEPESVGLKGKLKMPKFDKPKFGVSPPKAEGLEGEVSLPTAEVELPSATVTAAGEGPALGIKADVPGAKTEGAGWKVEKPSLKMPKADIKAPKVDISLPSVDVTLPKAGVDLPAPEAALSLEGEAKAPEKEAAKTKDGKFKMPKFGMPSFGWSSSREAKGTVAADVDVSLKEPQVTVPSGTAEVDVTLPAADIQAPGVEVTVETAAGGDGEKGRFKMPDVKMPSVKLPKVKAPHVQVSLPKAEVSLPKAQAEVQAGEVALQGPDAEGGLEVSAGKVEAGGMKIHMPKVKVPGVVFSKPTVKAPKIDADVSLPGADLKADVGAISIAAPDVKVPSLEGSLELQAPEIDLKVPSGEGSLDAAEPESVGLKGKLKMPKFDKPKFGVSPPKAEGLEGEVSLPTAEVELPSATVTAAGEGPALGIKADVPGAKTEGAGWKVEKPSLKMPKADIKAPKVDISLPSVDVTLPKAGVDLPAPEAALSLEGEAKAPEKEAAKTKDGKFKMPKFGMPSFGWSSSREAKGTVAADVDVSLKEPQVTVPSGTAEVDVTLPAADIQAPGVEVTVETAAGGDGEKGRFKMPDVKMPSVKLPKVKAPHVQVSLPKAEVSLPKAQAEVQAGEVALQGPDAEGGLEVSAGKVEAGGMKIHMPKVKVPGVVFSKPTVKAPKIDADVSLPGADLKADVGAISIAAPDVKVPSLEGSLELQAPEIDLKVPSGEGSLDAAEPESVGLKGKLKMPKFDKPKFGVSPPKAEGLEGEVSLPTAEVELPSATVTAAGEGPALGIKADVPGAKTEGAGWKVEKPSLKMPKADIKAPKVDISLPSIDVTLPKAGVDLPAPEAALSLEGEAKAPEKEAAKTKDGKFKMPKFGMPSFGWSSSREAKGTVAADVDVSLKEPQVTVPSGTAEVDVTLPAADIQAPGVEVTVETAAGGDGEKGRFKMPDVKMPSVKLPKVKAPHVQVSLPKAEVSLPKAQAEVQAGEVALQGPDAEGGLEVSAGKVEAGGMKIHMPKVKVPGVVFSKPTVKAPKIDADVSLPGADLKADVGAISIAAPDVKVPSLEGSLELQAPEIDLKVPSGEGSLDAAEPESVGLKGKLKMPKFDKPKFGVSPPKAEGLEGEVSLPTAEVELPSATVTAAGEGPALGIKADVPGAKTEGAGWKVEKPSLKMPKADIKAPKVDISLPSVDVTLPKAGVDLPAPEAALSLEGEAKAPEKEAAKTKDGKFKMPKFGMPSFGWSSSREAKGTVAADVDVSLKEPQVTVPSGTAEVDVTLPAADIQAPGVEVTVETAAGGDGEKGRFKMPDVKMPSVKLPKVKAPHVQVSLPKAEVSLPKAQAEVQAGEVALQGPDAEGGLEVSAGKVEAGGMKIHMPKVKVPGVVFSKPTVKAPKIDADVSLPGADLKADVGAISIAAPDVKVPSLEGSLELQAPEIDLKVPSGEGSLDAAEPESVGLKGKLKMPKFDKPKFGVSPPKAEGLEGEVSLPTAEVELPSATVTAAGEGPALGIKADVPGAKTEGAGWKVEKPSLKMPKADIKAPKVDISLPSVDVTLPKAGVDLPAPEAALSLEGEAKAPEKEAAKTKDGKFKMPKFGMPSFGWSSSREAKGTVAADVDVSLKEPQVTVPSGTAEVDVTLPAADIQAPGVEVTVETAAGGDGEKGRFKMPDVKMPSVKLPKVKAPHVQVSLPKAEVSLPKAQAEVQAGEVALQGPDAEGGLEVSAGKVEAGGMKIHMPKVKVPGVVFSKPTVKAPKIDADVSLPGADLKADVGAISIAAPDVKVPSLEGSLELQAPEIDLKVPSGEGSLDAAEPESVGLKGKLKMPKFDKPKFGVSPPKAEGLEGEVSLPTAEVELPSATVTAAGEGPALGIKADVPGAKTEGAGWKVEKPSLKMPKADIKAPKVDISLPSVDVTLPKAGVDLPAPEAALSLEGEAKAPEKEAAKTKDGKFKMPKFGMPSFGWSSSREAKGTVAADVDVSLKEPQVTVPSGTAEVDVTLPAADIQAPGVEVTVETAAGGDGEKGRFKMPDVKMPSVKLPKVKAPHVQVSLPKAEVSLPKAQAEVQAGEVALQGPDAEGGLEVSAGKVEAGGMKIHMPKVKVPGVVFSKPTVKAPKIDADVSLPGADLKADVGAISIAAPDVKVPSLEGSLELQAPEIDLKVPSGEGSLDAAEPESVGLKGKLKMPKFDKPKFGVSPPKAEGLEGEVSLPTAEVELPSATVTAAGEGPALGIKADVPGAKTEGAGWKVEKPSLKMPKADIKAPKVDISLPSVDVTLPKAGVDLPAPEAALSLEGEAKAPEKEAAKTKDGKFKMPKFGMPSFGWSSSREAKGTVAADVDVSLKEPQVTVPSGTAEVDVTLPAADIQAPGVEVTVETAAGGDGEKGRFKMPDVKMPSVKLPKVKAPHVQVSLPKAEVSLPKAQAEVQAGEVALQGPDAEGGLEVSAGKVEAGGMKIHMPKVKVPGVVFSKPTVKAPKIDADVSLPGADLKADVGAISIAAPDVKVPSLEGSLELQAPEIDLKVPSGEGSLDAAEPESVGLKGKLKMPKFDKPKFGVSPPKAEGLEGEVSLPTAEVELPSATVTAAGEGPALGIKADVPGAKTEGAGWKVEKPSLKMPKADIKAPKVDISLPSVDVTLPKAGVDLPAPEAALSLEGEAKAPEKEAAKTKDGKFKMPKFGMPSFGWSSSREAKGTVAADVDVSLKEPQVTVPSGTAEVDVTLPAADIQAPGVEVTVETAAGGDGEKGRFKMPDVKMPSVKLPKVKAPHVQVSLPKAEVSLPKAQAEVQAGEVALQGPDAEGGLEVSAGKVEAGGMKIHMPKVKVPGVVFSKPTVKAPKIDADVSLPGADLKADVGAISIAAPDVKVPSLEGSLELQAPEIDLKVPSGEGSLDAAEPESVGLKGKLKMPKFDKPKFGVSPPKAEGLEGEVSLPTAEVELPSATVTAAGEGPALGIKADVPGAKTEGAGWKVEKPSLKMPKADIKAPKVDISLPSVDVTLPKAGVDLPAPEAALSLEGEAKAPEKEAAKTKDGKFKMPKFGMPSFGWSSSREAKGTVAADVDVSLKEPQVTVPSGTAEVDVTLPAADIQAPGVEVTVETAAGGDGEKGRFKMPDVKMPSVKLPKVKAPHVQVSLPKAEVSLPKAQAEVQAGEVALQGPDAEGGLEVSAGKVEAGGMKIHMPKVKVPGVVFSKPTVKAPKIDADVSLPGADLKADVGAISIAAPDVKVPSLEGSLELQAPEIDLRVPSGEGSLDAAEPESVGLKGKLKMPKFDKPKFGVSPPKAEGLEGEVSLPTAEVELPSATVTAAGEGPALGIKADVPGAKTEGAGWKVEKPSLKMPKADIKAPKVDISLPSVDVTLPKAGVDLPAPEAALSLEGEAKAPEKEAAKTKDGKFKMPKFGMPSFGWSSSREAKGTVAADVDVSLKEPQVTVPSGTAEVDVTLPAADIQAPGVEVTVETAAGGDGEKGRFKMPDVKMPSVKLPKVKAPHVQVSLPKAEVSLPKAQAEVQAGEVALQGPDAEGGLEVSAGKVEAGGMKIHMPKVKVPGVVFSKPTVKAPKIDADVSLPGADLKADVGAISIAAPDVKVPSLEGSLELQAPEIDLKVPSGEGSLDAAEPESVGLKGKLKMPKFDKPKFGVSPPKAEGLEGEVSLPTAEVELPSATVTAAGEGPALGIKADVPGAKTEGAGWKVEKPSLKMPKADIKAPKVDISLPSVDVTLPKAGVDLPAPEAALSLEGEAKAPEKEAAKTKDGKFKMPKFGMPSFGWSSSREAKGTVAADVDVSLKEPQVTVPSGTAEVDVTLPAADIQAPSLDVVIQSCSGKEDEMSKAKSSVFKMPKFSLYKGSKPQTHIMSAAELSVREDAPTSLSSSGKSKGLADSKGDSGSKNTKFRIPSLGFSKIDIGSSKIEQGSSIPKGDVTLTKYQMNLTESGSKIPSLDDENISVTDFEVLNEDGSLEEGNSKPGGKTPTAEISVFDTEVTVKIPKFRKPKFGISFSKGKSSDSDVGSTVESDVAVEAQNLEMECNSGIETYSPEVKMTKADSKAAAGDAHLPSADISIPRTDRDIQDSDAALKMKGEIKQDGEEKEGHFKIPKFKLPSFSLSPKKEAGVKPDSEANLEDHTLAVMSGRTDTEVRGTATDDQGTGPALDLEISAGKVEQKSPVKKPQFVMPKISLSKIKVPKSQTHSPKGEAGATIPKTEREGDDSIQILDIERSHFERTEEGAQISIKLTDVKIPTLEFSKTETGASQTGMAVSSAKIGAGLPPSEGSFQQVVLKSSSTSEDTTQKPSIMFPKGEVSVEMRSPEIVTESSSVVDGRKMKLEGSEGKIKLPTFQKPKFGISLTKEKVPESEISSPKIEAEIPQLKMADEIADIAVGVPASELTSDMSDPGVCVYDYKMKTPQVLTAGTEVPKVDISPQAVSKPVTEGAIESLEEKEIKLKEEHEIKAEEVQTEEHQGWFKMPKFRIPSFGRTTLKEKKGDADIERSMGKTQAGIPSAQVQTETSIPENTFSLPHAVAEITIGKEGIPKLGDSVKSSDVSLPKMEGEISLPAESTDSRVNIPKPETYADIVKHGAKGQKMHTYEFTVSSAEVSKSYLSASETDKDNSLTNSFLTHTLTVQEHKVKSQDIEIPKVESSTKLETSEVRCKPSSAEVTLDATQEKIDVSIPKEELDIQNLEAVIKKGKIKGEIKITGKDGEGRPTCEWSTTKGSEDGVYVTAKLEDLKVEVPGVKMDVKIATVDPEMKFQVESVEKDMSAGMEVQVEGRAETSKIKPHKCKIPKFGVLHSEVKGSEDDINLQKSEADSVSKTELGTAEMQFQKSEGSTGLKSSAPDHTEASAKITVETVDKSQDGSEINIKIPKLKIPRFTFQALPTEVGVSVSKVVTDPKGSSTDIEVVQLQASCAIPEETREALEGGIQKAKSKILTLTEPDIKTAQVTTTIESSRSNAGQDIHWSYVEGQEVSEKVEPEHVAIERCEIYTAEILKESEILSPEVKTATLGFSLRKVKLPESHSNLEVLVQQPSLTEDVSVSKPKCAGESFGVEAQGAGSAELKLSDKPHSGTEESSGEVLLPKLKKIAVEVKPSSKPEERDPYKSPEGITAGPLSKDEDVAEALVDDEKDITNEQEKTDSKRSGRFKFWLPTIGFSSSGDETSTDSKTEVKKSVPEDVKPADTPDDSSKQTEKTGWFRFPKLGFTSPSKKSKPVDKEETGHKEGKVSDEDSPSDKPDVFFDAQESLSPKETTEGEKVEIDRSSSNVPVSGTIVTSSARTELILLEEEKDSQSNVPGDTTK
ncbi:protein AHNAK2 [Rhynochetos jubatus]